MAANVPFSIKNRFRILNWFLTCSLIGASGERVFNTVVNLMDGRNALVAVGRTISRGVEAR
jgi:hypothetical protein